MPLKQSLESIDPNDADIFVDMGESAITKKRKTLGTVGLGPCIGIALHDSNNFRAYLAHLHPDDTEEIKDIFGPTIQKDNNAANIKAWLAGGGYTLKNPDCRTVAVRDREAAVRHLLALGIVASNITTTWVEDARMSASMLLDTATGDCVVKIDDDTSEGYDTDWWLLARP